MSFGKNKNKAGFDPKKMPKAEKSPSLTERIDSITDEQKKKGLILLGIIGIVAFIGCFGYSKLKIDSNNRVENVQQNQISGLENKIDVKKAANNRKIAKATQEMTGLNFVRKDQDDGLIDKFLMKACTWNNGQQYRRLRKEIMQEYGISDKSSFMTVFMPKLDQTGMGVGRDGTNEIDDNKLNLKYGGMTSYVTNISGNNYSYLAIVTVESHDRKGAVATGTIAFRYTINGNRKITKMSASTVGYNGEQ